MTGLFAGAILGFLVGVVSVLSLPEMARRFVLGLGVALVFTMILVLALHIKTGG